MSIQQLKSHIKIALSIYLKANTIDSKAFNKNDLPIDKLELYTAYDKAIKGIDVITEQLRLLTQDTEHDPHGEIENVIFAEFDMLIDNDPDFEENTLKSSITERYHYLLSLMTTDLASQLFIRTPDLDKLEEKRIDQNNTIMNDGDEPIDAFGNNGTSIHDPSTDESTTCTVDPIKYYGLNYLIWYNRDFN